MQGGVACNLFRTRLIRSYDKVASTRHIPNSRAFDFLPTILRDNARNRKQIDNGVDTDTDARAIGYDDRCNYLCTQLNADQDAPTPVYPYAGSSPSRPLNPYPAASRSHLRFFLFWIARIADCNRKIPNHLENFYAATVLIIFNLVRNDETILCCSRTGGFFRRRVVWYGRKLKSREMRKGFGEVIALYHVRRSQNFISPLVVYSDIYSVGIDSPCFLWSFRNSYYRLLAIDAILVGNELEFSDYARGQI